MVIVVDPFVRPTLVSEIEAVIAKLESPAISKEAAVPSVGATVTVWIEAVAVVSGKERAWFSLIESAVKILMET